MEWNGRNEGREVQKGISCIEDASLNSNMELVSLSILILTYSIRLGMSLARIFFIAASKPRGKYNDIDSLIQNSFFYEFKDFEGNSLARLYMLEKGHLHILTP
jgi:hypothetical protein